METSSTNYIEISENVYTHRQPRLLDRDDVSVCSCRKRSHGQPEGTKICTDATCENVATSQECLIGFCSKSRCANQRFQRRQWLPVEIFDAGS
jgi:hypothetical protein